MQKQTNFSQALATSLLITNLQALKISVRNNRGRTLKSFFKKSTSAK